MKAEKRIKVTHREVPKIELVPVETPEYILTLTEEEAYLLRVLVGSVGGVGPKRNTIEAIWSKLVGWPELRAASGRWDSSGSITFIGE